ncbi:MAG: XdhC family protein [Melioribacteraceae bacterium]|nr:XdhC family protein [Melioribacteraceae bacterium]
MKKNIWKFILTKLEKNISVVLLVVAQSKGSAPGRQGFKMAVSGDNELFGTIGGGKIEFDLVEYSKKIIAENESVKELKKFVHQQSEKDSSGMICGGSQDVIIWKFCEDDIENINVLLEAEKNFIPKIVSFNNNRLEITKCNLKTMKYVFSLENEDWEYSEKAGISDKVYIVGAGHVGLATANLLNLLNFEVILLDHRNDLDLSSINKNEIKFQIIDKYVNVDQFLEEGENSYVVIVTFEHSGDEEALKSLIGKNLKYLGMMGSKRKVKEIKENLLKAGIKEEIFENIHSPIGVKIKSETPDEIAVSIAAEIIDVKNSN